jgi:DNA-binding LytR/AlgR family response regulator
MLLRALVVDDELPAREELAYMLEASGKVRVVGQCEDGDEVMEFLDQTSVDVVFLDIQMRIQDGLSTAWQIMHSEHPAKIVFTTGYSQYAQKAFELNAVDYVMKPYLEERIHRMIEKVKDSIQAGSSNQPIAGMISGGTSFEPNRMPVWKDGRLLVLPYAEILFAKSDGKRKTVIATAKGYYTTNLTLRELETKLKPPLFLRTHKSYIANLEKVREIVPWFNNTYLLRLEGCEEHEIPVARHYIKPFQDMIGLA